MPRLTETLWMGGAITVVPGVQSILNVAQDLRGEAGWPDVDYMQVGLIDGPGNTVAAYHAAVLALVALQKRATTLVMCHGGSRSMSVCLMYLNLVVAERGWDGWIELLSERVDGDLPVPHPAHRDMFNKLNWKLLAEVVS